MIKEVVTPRVSILIPVYNRKNFITECIQSALDQTYTDFEIVVVDNSSDDGTWEICQRFAALDRRVKVFQNSKNIGPVRNWRKCLSESRGEIVKFLFSDDTIFPDFLETTIPYLKDPGVGFVSTAALIGERQDTASVWYSNSEYRENICSREYIKFLSNTNIDLLYSPGAAIFRRYDAEKNLIENIPSKVKHNFSINGAGPDILLFLLTANNYQSVVMIKKPLVFFRTHPESITMKNQNRAVTEGYRLAIAWFLKENQLELLCRRWIANIWLSKMYREKQIISLKKTIDTYYGTVSFCNFIGIFFNAIAISYKQILHRPWKLLKYLNASFKI